MCYLTAHNARPTTNKLNRRGINVHDECRLCGVMGETINHIFINCPKIQKLKKHVENQCSLNNSNLGSEEIIFHEGVTVADKNANSKIARYKHTIWILRAKIYYGQLTNNRIEDNLVDAYESSK